MVRMAFSIVFKNKNRRGHFEPPAIITKDVLSNLYSKTFFILNFQKKKNHGIVNPKLGIYRWVSGFGQGERFLVKK